MLRALHLTPDFAIAGQIDAADVAEIAASGFRAIINNRPDDEVPGQPCCADIAQAAIEHGLGYYPIPVHPGPLDLETLLATSAAIDACQGPVLAFCRSGARSTMVWAAARALAGDAPEQLCAAAANAGYDLTPMIDSLRALAGSQHTLS